MQGGVIQRQTMDRRPEVQRVTLGPAIRLEASECALAQMDREGPLPVPGVAVHRARTAALRAGAMQLAQESQVRQHPFQAHLFAQEGEIDLRSHDGWRRRRLDRRSCRFYGGRCRGDHSFRGQIPLVAPGSLVVTPIGKSEPSSIVWREPPELSSILASPSEAPVQDRFILCLVLSKAID
jgi:hypothetical protein